MPSNDRSTAEIVAALRKYLVSPTGAERTVARVAWYHLRDAADRLEQQESELARLRRVTRSYYQDLPTDAH